MHRIDNMSESLAHADQIKCPRCGYDLRGTVSTWTESCPIDGTCAECGLTFQWTHVLMISKFEPHWCVEFTPSWLGVPRATLRTLLRMTLPPLFWRTMHMSSRVRWGRLLAFALLMLLGPTLAYVPVQGTRAAMVRYEVDGLLQQFVASIPAQIASTEAQLEEIRSGGPIEQFGEWTREELIASFESGITAMKASQATGAVVNMSYLEAIWEGVTRPTATTSNGSIVQMGFPSPYPSPSEYDMVLSWRGGGAAFGGLFIPVTTAVEDAVLNLGIAAALTLLLPVTFILLPASRRKAKVQWRHIGRIAIYSISYFVVIAGIIALAFGLTLIPQMSIWVPDLTWQLPWALWLLVPIWWWSAIKRYLRMPHAFAVAFLMTLIIALLFMPVWLRDMPYWLERLVV